MSPSTPDTDEQAQNEYARIVELVRARDPLLVEAASEVDRSLLRWMLELSPRERLRAASRAAAALSRIRRGSP